MTWAQILSVILSVLTIAGTAINIFVSLRLAALQANLKADTANLEIAMLKQFIQWKDEVLQAINGKYVSSALITEIRSSIGRELGQIQGRLDHIESRLQ